MSMISKHAILRLRAVLAQPLQLAVLLFSGLVSVVFWPGLTEASGAGWPGGQPSEPRLVVITSMTMLFWLLFWPNLATGPMRGQTAGPGRGREYATRPHPTLPIGLRARTISEALAVLAVVLLFRAPVLLLGEIPQTLLHGVGHSTPFTEWFIEQSLAGALIMLPLLMLAGLPSRSIESHWLRSLVGVGLIFAAMKLGWLESLVTCAATSLGLAALVLLSARAEVKPRLARPFKLRKARPTWVRSSTSHYRAFRPPESQFRRDLWTRAVPVAAALVGAEGILLITDQRLGLPHLAFFFLSVMVISCLVSLVTLQPLRSKLAVAGIFGKPGFQAGDFMAACGVLPVRRKVVTRDLFVFGLVTVSAIWMAAVGTIVLSSWLETGRAALVDTDGDPLGRFLLPTIAVVPVLPSFLVCAVHGDRRGSYLSGTILLLVPPSALFLLTRQVSVPTLLMVIAGLSLVGLFPVSRHLRATGG